MFVGSMFDSSMFVGSMFVGSNLPQGPRHNCPDLIVTQNLPHLAQDAVPGAFDFVNPSLIDGADGQDAVRQLDRRSPRDGLTHGELPREIRSLFRRWLATDDFRENPR
jgi:hypothetical protein